MRFLQNSTESIINQQKNVVKKILYNVHGFDYVPENLKSNSFKATAKNLIKVHDALNNFYNEPLAAKLLSSMGTMIPDPAVYDCINSVLICIISFSNQMGLIPAATNWLALNASLYISLLCGVGEKSQACIMVAV